MCACVRAALRGSVSCVRVYPRVHGDFWFQAVGVTSNPIPRTQAIQNRKEAKGILKDAIKSVPGVMEETGELSGPTKLLMLHPNLNRTQLKLN